MTDQESEIELLKRRASVALGVLQQFPEIVERFVALTGRSQTEFGEKATGSADFVRHVRGGRDFRLSTAVRALTHIHESGFADKPTQP